MEQPSQNQFTASRRSFLGVAGFGALATMLPAPAWSFLAQEYPTLKKNIEAYIAGKKASGIVASIGRGLAAPDVINMGTIAFDSKTPVDMDTLFRVYSMTKPVTGIAAMILIEDGKMKLDQPIADFLPEFKDMRVLTNPESSMDSVPAKTQITVRHLLTHTAGLSYTISAKGPLLKAYFENGITPAVVSKTPIPGTPPSAPTPDLKTFAERLAKLPLVAEPGTKWHYSVSLDLLGRVIEVASGMDFEAFLQKRLFNPLKMTSSYFQVPQSEAKRLATNYAVFNGNLLPFDPGPSSIYLEKPAFAFGGAGLACSTRDYDRFLMMLLNSGSLDGVRVMSKKTTTLAMSNLLPVGTDTKGTFVDGEHFGAGGRVGVGPLAGSFGWSGAAGTTGFVHTKKKMRGIGMIQYMPSNAQDFLDNFSKWVIADTALLRK
jgi:CubicO group peptidase (beta-lactamase class C family)